MCILSSDGFALRADVIILVNFIYVQIGGVSTCQMKEIREKKPETII